MNTTSLIIVCFVGCTCLTAAVLYVINEVFFKYRDQVEDRLRCRNDTNEDAHAPSLFDDLSQLSANGHGVEYVRASLKCWISQSALPISVNQLLLASIGIGTIALLVVGCTSLNILMAVACAPIGAAIPFLVVYIARSRRLAKITHQLPEAFEIISRAVRAGQTVHAAMQIVAEDVEAPLGDEFARCYQQQNLGMSNEAALRGMASRTGAMELRIFVTALIVQMRAGGDLVSMLDSLAQTVRKRLMLRKKVKAVTGEGRMQAWVLIALPFMAAVIIAVIAPHYIASLLSKPYLVGATIGAQLLGALWIRKIINFKA